MIKRLSIAALLVAVWCNSAMALEKFQGFVEQGGHAVSTAGFQSTTKVQRSFPSATVTVYLPGTTTLATIYADSASTAKANPFTADTRGFWFFWASSTSYDVTFSGGGIPTPYTLANLGSSGSTGAVGAYDVASYATRGDGAVAVTSGTGTLSVTNGSANVTGVGTLFTTQLAVGDVLKINGVDGYRVDSISAPTGLVLHKVFAGGTGSYSFTFRKPWTGWDTATPWANYGAFYFRSGEFVAPILNLDGYTQLRLFGAGPGASVIIGTGTGNVIYAGSAASSVFGIVIDNLWIKSDNDATNAIYWEGVHHSTIRNVKVTDVANAALYIEFGVADWVTDFRVTGNEADQTVPPAYGIYTTRRGAAETTNALTVANTHIDQVTTAGVYLEHSNGHLFTNVVSEGNTGRGLIVKSTANRHQFISCHFEANTLTDVEVETTAAFNSFENSFVDGEFVIAGNHTSIVGGWIETVQISSGANYTYVSNVLYNLTGAGTFTNAGVNTTKINCTPASAQTSADISEGRGAQKFTTPNGNDGASYDPDYSEVVHRRINLVGTSAVNISDTVYTTGKSWRVLFIGYWSSVVTGPGLAMQPLIREVTSANPTFTVGGLTLTVQETAGVFQVVSTANYAGFVGYVSIFNGKYATGLATSSIVTPGIINSGGDLWNPVLFAALGTPTNGTFYYCSDCTIANPCGGGGTGALAKRLNGAWVCN